MIVARAWGARHCDILARSVVCGYCRVVLLLSYLSELYLDFFCLVSVRTLLVMITLPAY